jgi:peptide/nickel transport system ATP-binding protein
VVVQKGILLLLARLQAQMQSTIFFVSHDMGVHYQLSHKMLIMYAAKAVEFGDSETIFQAPIHPYTHLLIDALPKVGDNEIRQGVEGRPPSLWGELKGCRFAPRCPKAKDICREKEPALTDWKPGHFAACHFPDNV